MAERRFVLLDRDGTINRKVQGDPRGPWQPQHLVRDLAGAARLILSSTGGAS